MQCFFIKLLNCHKYTPNFLFINTLYYMLWIIKTIDYENIKQLTPLYSTRRHCLILTFLEWVIAFQKAYKEINRSFKYQKQIPNTLWENLRKVTNYILKRGEFEWDSQTTLAPFYSTLVNISLPQAYISPF